MPARRPTEVVLEVTDRKTFASALDWPGWSRGGPTPEAALEALTSYADRYAIVARLARVRFSTAAGDTLTVAEQVPGDAATSFGVPSLVTDCDRRPLTATEADRQVRLLRAGWHELDRLAVQAPEELRKGPRGGGRDRDKVVAHVIEAERSYARKIGVRHPPFHGDQRAVEDCREETEQVLRAARTGEPIPTWPARYFLRRAAWHVLDHVWEIEDKSGPDGEPR